MAKVKYPELIYVTQEDVGQEGAYFLVHKTAADALADSDGETVAIYARSEIRKGKLVPEWES